MSAKGIPYNHRAIEQKWQKIWDDEKAFAASDDYSKPKYYALVEFPYPSGQGLHVGHPRPYTALDIVARKRRMQGYNVLYPMGWDAFGLPTENYAIKNKIHPKVVTQNNVERFKGQLHALGYSFDWDREINTTDTEYYKWTQWIFLKLLENGLAYKAEMPINWCTSCKCVLANEEVVNGVCERCGSEVIRKEKSQWMLKITEYAQRLIDDLDDVDYIERVKIQQRNWIGRSTGAEITFDTNVGDQVTVYTTRADTLFGTTYMVISPEHPLLKKWQPLIKNWDAVAAYQEEAAHKSDFERTEVAKDKTGVRLEGVEAIRAWLKANHCEMRDLRFKKVTDGTIFDDGYLKVTAIPTQHCPDSHAFFVEAEGKAVLFTGDLKHPNVDFPKIAKEKPTEFIICEAAHFPATDYAPVLAACPTKQVLVNHYAPWNIPNVMQLAETLAPLPVKFVNDGMQITL